MPRRSLSLQILDMIGLHLLQLLGFAGSFAVGGRTEFAPSEKYQFLGEVWIARKADHEKLLAALDGTSVPREIIPLWMAKDILKPTD